MAAVTAWLTAQTIKIFVVLFLEHEFRPERLIGSGGMPSAHSATVCALAASAAAVHGAGSEIFAVTAVFAFVVMYDACNVRLQTGKQAVAIHELQALFRKMGQSLTAEERLKELVGHTIPQVIVGAILGIGIGTVVGMWN